MDLHAQLLCALRGIFQIGDAILQESLELEQMFGLSGGRSGERTGNAQTTLKGVGGGRGETGAAASRQLAVGRWPTPHCPQAVRPSRPGQIHMAVGQFLAQQADHLLAILDKVVAALIPLVEALSQGQLRDKFPRHHSV